MSDFRLVTLASLSYSKYLRVFCSSARKNCPDVKISVYLVNIIDRFKTEVKRINPNCTIINETVKFDNPMQERCYCTNRRGHILKDLREKTDDILMWLDADSVIRKPGLENLFKMATQADIGLKPKSTNDKSSGFMGGNIVINNTKGGKLFAEKYFNLLNVKTYDYKNIIGKEYKNSKNIKRIPSRSMKIWMSNQNILHDTYKILKDRVNFFDIPHKYLDTNFRDDGVVWTVKTSTRSDMKFNKEYNSYLRLSGKFR